MRPKGTAKELEMQRKIAARINNPLSTFFLTALHHPLRRPCIVVMDRFSAHRKAVRMLQAAHPDGFGVEWLSAYAPDWDPVEMVWDHTKYADLANFIPDDGPHLHRAVTDSLKNTGRNPTLLRLFFRRPLLAL
jgi:transposase